ncbi:polysulfide reductase, NrfD [Desulfitobacterium hafniense DP7]|uniref:Polysulfide reductase, NrfD n=2 Tax=Desulfitobacterium hafniense TaxID=49338 RepID=G9XJ38_DESHA|nr:polysulfide reductase, NrfD [Desulfitobacterium hafniense DP7]
MEDKDHMYHWGWKIIIYLFLGGLGAGAYLTSFAAQKGWLGENSKLGRAGYFLSGPCIVIGSLLLFLDLGIAFSDPLGVLRMFANITSVMTWGIYILSMFILVSFLSAYYTGKNRKVPAMLSLLGAILALGTGAYTGVLLAVVTSVPFWNTFLLPLLFVVSALSTGLAATALCAHFLENKGKQGGEQPSEAKTNKVHLVFLGLESILIMMLLAFALTGTKGTGAAASAHMLTSGSLALPFWLLVVAVGLVFPLVYYSVSAKERQRKLASFFNGLSTDFAVLIGGLTLRATIVLCAVRVF